MWSVGGITTLTCSSAPSAGLTMSKGVFLLYPDKVSAEDLKILREHLGFRKKVFNHGSRDMPVNEALERLLDAVELVKEVT